MKIEEAYELFEDTRSGIRAKGFWIDAVCHAIYGDDYDEGPAGFEQRQQVKLRRPSIYDELGHCDSLESFKGIIAQFIMEGL